MQNKFKKATLIALVIGLCSFSFYQFDKNQILQDILMSVYGELTPEEIKLLENQIQHIVDNKLVKRKGFFKKFGDYKKRSYNIIKTNIELIDFSIKLISNQRIKCIFPLTRQIPIYNSSLASIVLINLAQKLGLSIKVISIIYYFYKSIIFI